jgi:hypothetical protein
MALGQNKNGLYGIPDANRSRDSWQVETNADKFGNRSDIARAYDQTGIENIEMYEKHDFGDNFVPSYFLDIKDETFSAKNGQSAFDVSFDLSELVLSTGKTRK